MVIVMMIDFVDINLNSGNQGGSSDRSNIDDLMMVVIELENVRRKRKDNDNKR